MRKLAYHSFLGARADGRLVKGLVPQFDGSARAGDNCAGASEAMRCIRNQKGVRPVVGEPWPPTGASVRRATGDTSGGMTPGQTTNATKRVYRIANDVRIAAWSEVTAWLRKGGSCVILIGYRPIAEAGKSGSPGFYDNHSVDLAGIDGTGTAIRFLVADPLYDGRRSGIPEGPQWISIATMKRAASALSLSPGRTMGSMYPGKVYASFGTRAYTPPVAPFRLYPGATKLKRPRTYTPTRRLWLRRTPKLVATNHIGTVAPGFGFEAYQYGFFGGVKFIGNKTGTAWLVFDSVKFVRYI